MVIQLCDQENIKRFQSWVLRNFVNAPWYIRTDNFHRDFKVQTVADETKRFAMK